MLLRTQSQVPTTAVPAPAPASATKPQVPKKKRVRSTGVREPMEAITMARPGKASSVRAPAAAGGANEDVQMSDPEEGSSDAESAEDGSSSEEEDGPDYDPRTRGEDDPEYDGADYDTDELLEMWEADSDDEEGGEIVWTEKMLTRVNARKYKWR